MKNFIYYGTLLIGISSIIQWCTLPLSNTFIWWLISGIYIIACYKQKIRINIIPINLFIAYLFISAIYGAFYMATNYWDWKLLASNLLFTSLLLCTYYFSNPIQLSRTLQVWYKYGWIIFIFLIPFLASDAFGRYLIPYSFLAMFITIIKKKYYIILIGIAFLITYYWGYEDRSSTIKFVVSLCLGLSLIIWNIWKNISDKIFKILHCILILFPIVFSILGISGIFNILNIKEELNIEDTDKRTEYGGLTDTRTGLYVEEITSAIDHNYVLYGRSIARGYDSIMFGDAIDKAMGIKRGERPQCEVCILNIFNYMGIIGVLLYFLIFLSASYKAIYQSNNQYVKIIGLYVAFRWVYSFIHDGIEFNLNFLFIIISLSICYSPYFRKMSEKEFKLFINKSI